MLNCVDIYYPRQGGSSPSGNVTTDLAALPRVGDTIHIQGIDGGNKYKSTTFEVESVEFHVCMGGMALTPTITLAFPEESEDEDE